MILKYKYHSDSGLLEAYRSYTLAQNNSLSDTIVITSTALDAERYNYCLEFICYNSKSIPKAQYISPILNYSDDGISFAVPNNLTEFRGHVDIQLTGYDPDDNSIVFKSISKNCKAFDVEGSLCVLEKDLNDTPNVFTEVLKQVEEIRNLRQDILDEAMTKFSGVVDELVFEYLKAHQLYKVKFYVYGKLIEERWVAKGSKLIEPQYTLPDYCVVVGGWYNRDTEEWWNIEEDTAQGDMELALNFMTDDVVISGGVIQSLGIHAGADIYFPDFYEGEKVTSVSTEISRVPDRVELHYGYFMEELGHIAYDRRVQGAYFPDTHPDIVSKEGRLYLKSGDEIGLLYCRTIKDEIIRIDEGCLYIYSYALSDLPFTNKIILPNSMTLFQHNCITKTNIEELILPESLTMLDEFAISNNYNLKRVIIKGDVSGTLTDNTIVNISDKGVFSRPTLYVQAQHYNNYKALGLSYEIKVLGDDYYDEKYAPIGE
ncbi:MAG: leucine-rich repeat domain-containing protein [Clostridia bacterium]|nr:leucine-rich repeat domain-containing protein [Clostridia bacterium]